MADIIPFRHWEYQTLEEALAALEDGMSDAIGDYGEEVVDGGGWIEITRAVMRDCHPEIAAEIARMHGLDSTEMS